MGVTEDISQKWRFLSVMLKVTSQPVQSQTITKLTSMHTNNLNMDQFNIYMPKSARAQYQTVSARAHIKQSETNLEPFQAISCGFHLRRGLQ